MLRLRRPTGPQRAAMCKVLDALLYDEGATLDDLREAVTTLAEITRTARRVMGGTHPLTVGIEGALREAWALLCAHETPPAGDK